MRWHRSFESRRYVVQGLLIFAAVMAPAWSAWAAESAPPLEMARTSLVLKLDAPEPVAIRTTYRAQPPTITIEFPAQRVVGSLPERSTLASGVIRIITTRYEVGPRDSSKRFVRSIQLGLSAPYVYHVRSEPQQVVVEIDHPAMLSSAAVEVGVRGGTIIHGLGAWRMSERFRAMQDALAQATPVPWRLQLHATADVQDTSTASAQSPPGRIPDPSAAPAQTRRPAHGASSSTGTTMTAMPRRVNVALAALVLILCALMVTALSLGAFWLLSHQEAIGAGAHRGWSTSSTARLPAGFLLIDQLVWRAFERQGYRLVSETALTPPLAGTLRLMTKDGPQAALLYIDNGPFFEKQTVERFARAMREAHVTQGVLVASGSFTVPAQRLAKDRHVTLIGREQLAELLSVGASSEYLTKQLEQSHARLEEAKQTLRQYAEELDVLRRQRNEASWYLGEERAKSAKLEADVTVAHQQLRHDEVELKRWEEEALCLRKQWEQSEWYLGEARARIQHLDTQLSALQELTKRLEAAERQQAEANWYLGEERTRRQALETERASIQQALEAAVQRERMLQETLDGLHRELQALQAYGERRAHRRNRIPAAVMEVYDGAEDPLFAGCPRDLSGTGFGLSTERELPRTESLRVRLQLPDHDVIESRARLIWQQTHGEPTRYSSGCQFLEISDEARMRIAQCLGSSSSSET